MQLFNKLVEKIGKKKLIVIAIALALIIVAAIVIPIVVINSGGCEHTYDNACDAICNECGEEREITHSWKEANCTAPKTCKICGATDGEALGHKPSADDGDCTTEVKCTVCGEVTTPAKAEHKMGTDGKCVDCGYVVEVIPPTHEHIWSAATYEWNADHTVCTATRVCTVDEIHKETENGAVTSQIAKDATCAAKGETTYTATFTNIAFATQTKTVEDIPVSTEHTWGEVAYEWNADNTICTATITCTLDENHKKAENAIATKSTAGNCDTGGTHTYTATFSETEFDTQIKTESFEAGHDYQITYHWEYGGAVCHAKHSCYHCADTTKEEIAMREAVVITVTGDCSTGGTLTRTATFADSTFETQTKTEAFSAGEHIFRGICSTQCESCEKTVRTVEASDHTILRPYTNFECDVCMKGSTLEGWAPDSDDSEFG